jgi:hypothetical protein
VDLTALDALGDGLAGLACANPVASTQNATLMASQALKARFRVARRGYLVSGAVKAFPGY